jgi:hypothetical protein
MLRSHRDGLTSLLILGALLIAPGVEISFTSVATAHPITISDPFLQLYAADTNSDGSVVGDFVRFGAGAVPNGLSVPPTTGFATTINTSTDQPFTEMLQFSHTTASPNFYSSLVPNNTALYGPWTLTFTNGTNTASVTVPAIPTGTQQAPFVQSVTISGTSLNPTFNWNPPPNTQVNGYSVQILDKDIRSNTGAPDLVYIATLAPSQHTFTIPTALAGGLSLTPGGHYSLAIELIQTRDNTNLTPASGVNNTTILAQSRVFADFTPQPTGSPQVNLPVILSNGSFQFNMTVTPGQTYYIDPSVTTGYVYRTGANNPNFASVILPSLQSTPYILSYVSNGSLIKTAVQGGGLYVFLAQGGVNMFTVTDINPSLGLDPKNTTAFITGLTFVGSGNFTGTQTPISATPLPAALPLFAAGLGMFGLFGWRRNRKSGTYRNSIPSFAL